MTLYCKISHTGEKGPLRKPLFPLPAATGPRSLAVGGLAAPRFLAGLISCVCQPLLAARICGGSHSIQREEKASAEHSAETGQIAHRNLLTERRLHTFPWEDGQG